MHNGFLDKRRRHLNLREMQVESVLPEHFAQAYPKFISLLKRYYEWQDQNNPNELLNHLFAARDINETDITLLSFIEDEFLLGEAYFEGFGDTEAEKRAAANFSNQLFRSKGTKFAIEWFFRSFYGLDADVRYPKENVFTLNTPSSQIGPDSVRYITNNELYQTFALLVRVGVPISEWRDIFKLFAHPAGMYLGAEVSINDVVTSAVNSIMLDSAVTQRRTEEFSISASPNPADEGTEINFTVFGDHLPNNIGYVYYHVEDVTTSDSDFVGEVPRLNSLRYLALNDSDNDAIGEFTIPTRIDSDELEGPETFRLVLRDDDLREKASTIVTLNDVISSYVMTPTTTLATEGIPVTFNITGTNVPNDGNTTLYYYVRHLTTSDSDFSTAPPDSENPAPVLIRNSTGAFSITPKFDGDELDSGEQFSVVLQTLDAIEKAQSTITIADPESPFLIDTIQVTLEGRNIIAPLTIPSQDIGDTLTWAITGAASTDPRIPEITGSFEATEVEQNLLIPTIATAEFDGVVNGTLTVTNSNYNPALSVNNVFTIVDSAAQYLITMDPAEAFEGDTVEFNISGRNIEDGTYYFYIGDVTTDATDFSGGRPEITGPESVTITNNSGTTNTVTFAVKGASADKNFITYLYDAPFDGDLLTSAQFTILAANYSLTADRTSVNEGATVNFDFIGADGTYYYWFEGLSGRISGADFSSPSPFPNTASRQSFTVAGGIGSFSATLKNDLIFEGPETFNAQVSTSETAGPVGTSQTITVNDTSTQQYTLSVNSITEGQNLIAELNVVAAGASEVLFYEITGAATAKFSSTQLQRLYPGPSQQLLDGGTQVISIDFGTSASSDLYQGNLSGTVTVSRGGYASSGGTVLASDTFSVIDLNAAYTLTASTTNPTEGDSIVWTIGGTNIPDGTYFYKIVDWVQRKSTTGLVSTGSSLIPLNETSGLQLGMSCDNPSVPGTITFIDSNRITMSSGVTASISSGTILTFAFDVGQNQGSSVFSDIASGYAGSVSITANAGGFTTVTAENIDTTNDSYTMGLYTSATGNTPVATVGFTITDGTPAGSTVTIFTSITSIADRRDNYEQSQASITFTSDGKIIASGNLDPGGLLQIGTWSSPTPPVGNYVIRATGEPSTGSTGVDLSLSSSQSWSTIAQQPGPPASGLTENVDLVTFTITDTADANNTDTVSIRLIAQSEGSDENQCFTENSLVTLDDGSKTEIRLIAVGDRVRGADGSINEVTANRSFSRVDTIYGWAGAKPFVTGSHPFLTTEGWKCFDVEAGQALHPELGLTQLREGDSLVVWNGKEYSTSVLENLVSEEKEVNINSLSVTGNDTYIVNGFVVHNK